LIVNRYFVFEKEELITLDIEIENIKVQMQEIEDEQTEEEDLLAFVKAKSEKNEKEKITKKLIQLREKAISGDKNFEDELKVISSYLSLLDRQTDVNRKIRDLQKALESKVWNKYRELTDREIKVLVVDDKWIQILDNAIHTEMQRISQGLTQRIKELADRYETPLPVQLLSLKSQEQKINIHLSKMGFVWN
jgi:type I restriction enzyme M protein